MNDIRAKRAAVPPRRFRNRGPGRGALIAAWVLVAAAGCGRDAAGPGATKPPPECSSAADCRSLATDVGKLCVAGVCTACSDAAACEAEPLYGSGAVCVDGACTVCKPGETGCRCLDDRYCVEGAGCRDGLCRPCKAGTELCPCASEACDGDLQCTDGICRTASCAAGAAGCACRDGACDGALVCGEGSCRQCPNTVDGCPCTAGACGEGRVCDSGTRTCRTAISCEELACGEGRLCGSQASGFRCLEDCAPGYEWDAVARRCQAVTGATCTPGDPNSLVAQCEALHRVCDASSGPAHCGACKADGFECWVEDAAAAGGACRAAVGCASCASEHRSCTPAAGCGDAACGDCLPGYHVRGTSCVEHTLVASCDVCTSWWHRSCEPDGEGGVYCGDCVGMWHEGTDPLNPACLPTPNCLPPSAPGVENSLLESCAAAPTWKTCVEATATAEAHCGGCLDGYLEDTSQSPSLCIPQATCRSNADCPGGPYFCGQLAATATLEEARCRKVPCPEGQAWDRLAGRCKNCSCVEDTSHTGAVWPVTDEAGACICIPKDGYFYDPSASGNAENLCDADLDGWVSQKVYQTLQQFKDDFALRANARCEFNAVTDFVLVNEWSQRKTINVAAELQALTSGRPSVILYETTRNDTGIPPTAAAALPKAPAVGATPERTFLPAEVNSLTKACIDPLADLNHDERSDLEEKQQDHGEQWRRVFSTLSYFTELYRGEFVPTLGADGQAMRDAEGARLGKFVIRERQRCDPQDFFLRYQADDPRVGSDPDPYWKSCTRRRDAQYKPDEAGYDFARFDCDPSDCIPAQNLQGAAQHLWSGWQQPPGTRKPVPVPPVTPPVPPRAFEEIAPHGACDRLSLGADDLKGMPWRGMTHYSQFRCAKLVEGITPATRAWVAVTEVAPAADGQYTKQRWQLDVCGLNPRVAGEATGTSSFTCQAQTSGVTDFVDREGARRAVWLVHRYADYDVASAYVGGCINEGLEWPQLCPRYLNYYGGGGPCETLGCPSPPVLTDGDPNQFGRLVCGCGLNYGGANCELGCPLQSLMTSKDYTFSAPRNGYWLCGRTGSGGVAAPAAGTEAESGALVGTEGPDGGVYRVRGAVFPEGLDSTAPAGGGSGLSEGVDGGLRVTPWGIP